MILSGGRVDELGVLTFYRPKSTVPFGGLYRFIDFPLSNMLFSGIDRVGILCQYRAKSLVEHIGTGAAWDMIGRHRGITLLPPFQGLHAADWYQGTADAVYQNLDFLDAHKPDLVLVVSGDHVYSMDYQRLIEFHMDMDAEVTAAFVNVPIEGSHRFGLGKIAHDDERGGRLIEYAEKPERPISSWASMTVYLFDYQVLKQALIRNAREVSHEFGRDIFPMLLQEGKRVYGYKFQGYWAYCRTLDEYWQANMDLLGLHPRLNLDTWRLRTNLDHEAIRDRAPALIATHLPDEGLISNIRAYNGVKIDGKVEDSILFPGVHIAPGAYVKDSILFYDTQIGPGARVERTITDIGASIGKEARIGRPAGELTVIGMDSSIPMKVEIGQGCMVYPGLQGKDFKESSYPDGTSIVPDP
jgi:glucose-1-phosphate adenylyltransferase